MKNTDELQWISADPTYGDGWVWDGYGPATQGDIDDLVEYLKSSPFTPDDMELELDSGTLVGRFDATFSCASDEPKSVPVYQRRGGLGSQTYQTQRVAGRNYVEFREEGEGGIWHYHDGQRVYGTLDYPKTGRAWFNPGDGSVISGPQPGTRASRLLGEKSYVWDATNEWWSIK